MSNTQHFLIGGPNSQAWKLGHQVESQVFLERFENTPEQLAQEYGPYETGSMFVTLVHGKTPIASARLITNASGSGLKSINDAKKPPWNLKYNRQIKVWDWATLSVVQEYTGLNTSHNIISKVLELCFESKVKAIVALLDRKVLNILTDMGGPIRQLGPAAPYLGSPATIPIEILLAELSNPNCWSNLENYAAIVGHSPEDPSADPRVQ